VAAAGVVAGTAVACQPRTVVVKETVEVEKQVEKVVKETVVVEKEVVKEVEVAKTSGRQAPILQELVQSGALPPLEERMPVQPLVVSTGMLIAEEHLVLEIGTYGGEMRHPSHNPGNFTNGIIYDFESPMDVPGLEGPVYPNVFRSYEISPDSRIFTYYMREGMRWNDGEPITTEDVRFAWEDALLNENITSVFPTYLKNGASPAGAPGELKILDDYRFSITFEEPYGGFAVQLTRPCHWRSYQDIIKPKHYLQQFHVDYTPLEKLEPLLKEESLAAGEWWTLFTTKDINRWNLARPSAIGMPALVPFLTIEETAVGTVIMERNPYYWKVDTEGNQLPYFDRHLGVMAETPEMAIMMVMSGEGDHSYEYAFLGDYPLYKENEEKGGYVTVIARMHRTMVDVCLNLTHDDPTWRQVVRDHRFREALTTSINREELIEAVYLGFAKPPLDIPSGFDLDKANALLDEMGMDKRDGDGFRLGPDGETFLLPINHDGRMPEFGATAELVREYFSAVGVKTTVKQIEGALQNELINSNEILCSLQWNSHPEMWCYTCDTFPFGYMNASAPMWVDYLQTDGATGQDPKESDLGKAYIEMCETMWATMAGPDHERAAGIAAYSKIMYDNIFRIPSVGEGNYAVLVSNDIGNVPYSGYGIAQNFCGEVFYRKQ
jgi:peptide/nickel transport system substrate-binding protein